MSKLVLIYPMLGWYAKMASGNARKVRLIDEHGAATWIISAGRLSFALAFQTIEQVSRAQSSRQTVIHFDSGVFPFDLLAIRFDGRRKA